MSAASLELDLQDAAAQPAPAAGDFERWVAAAVAGLREATELTVRLVDEDEGRELNARYRDKDYATNVLSFPSALPEGLDLPYIGDVVICPAVVVREAAEQGKTEEAHWAHLTVHGVLHLLGYDHEEEPAAAEMEGLEVRILEGLGYPDPYQTGDAEPAGDPS